MRWHRLTDALPPAGHRDYSPPVLVWTETREVFRGRVQVVGRGAGRVQCARWSPDDGWQAAEELGAVAWARVPEPSRPSTQHPGNVDNTPWSAIVVGQVRGDQRRRMVQRHRTTGRWRDADSRQAVTVVRWAPVPDGPEPEKV